MYTLYTLKRTLVSLAFLLLVVPGSGMGTDADGRYEVYAFGLHSCGTFVEARRNRDDFLFATWFTGYMTAVNQLSHTAYSMLGTSDIEGAMLWIENYCRKNPLEPFAVASHALLLFELYPKHFTKAPK